MANPITKSANEPVRYVLQNGFGMSVRVNVGDKAHRLVFKDRMCSIDDAEVAKALDTLLENQPQLAAKIKKVDKAAADALVRKLLAEKQPGAIQGAASSSHFSFMQKGAQNAEATVAEKLGKSDAKGLQEVVAGADMLITEKQK